MKNLKCMVVWDIFNDSDENDNKTAKEYEKNILIYIKMFKALPPIGLFIDNEYNDPAKIKDIVFNGIGNSILVEIEWV